MFRCGDMRLKDTDGYGLMNYTNLIRTVNSLRQSDEYIRQWTGPSLAQIMACHQFSTKPLSGPVLVQCELDPWGKFLFDQSHRYGRHQAACREPAGSYDKTTRTAICFEHKTQYILIRAPYTRILVFWHISNIPLMISQSQISCNTPTLYIAAIFVRYCYTTGNWLL